MKKLESIISELFTTDAISPLNMSKIYGGAEPSGAGSHEIAGTGTTITWTSDNADGTYNSTAKASGTDVDAPRFTVPTTNANSNSNWVLGNPFDNKVNTANFPCLAATTTTSNC